MSAAEAAEIAALVNTVDDRRKFNAVAVASLTVLVYDIVLTLPEEIEFVWNSKMTWGKVLYFANRYLVLANQIGTMPFWFIVDPSLRYCKVWFLLDVWTAYIFVLPAQFVIGARTFAMYNGSQKIKWLILIVFILSFITVISSSILYMAKSTFSPLPLGGLTCIYTIKSPRSAGMISNAGAAIYELLVWSLLAIRSIHLAKRGESKLVRLVFRDSLIYVTIVTMSAVTTVFLHLFVPLRQEILQDVLGNYTEAMGSVITSHILLHLRKYASYDAGVRSRTLADVSITTMGFRNREEPEVSMSVWNREGKLQAAVDEAAES